MTSSTIGGAAVRAALLACLAAGAVSACTGSDGVASPGEGVFIPSPPPAAPPPPPPPGPPPPATGPAADCPTGFINAGVVANNRSCQFPTVVTGTLNVPKRDGTLYSISGRVDVGLDLGPDASAPLAGGAEGILSIDPGVTIFGSGTLDYMVVNRGSQIFAVGSQTEPVIMTSRQSILGTTNENSIGQWGGLVVLGRAPTSVGCPAGISAPSVDCVSIVEGTNAFYGGDDINDNSGTLSFFRLMHSGYEILPNNELNGITLAGVGRGTVVENVQVHNSSDDGIELFGGTVNLRNIVVTGADDDSFDVDTGWRGAVQNMLLVQRPGGGDRPFEFSSAGDRTSATPSLATAWSPFTLNTQPRMSNVTIVGRTTTGAGDAIVLNSGNGLRLWNSVVTKHGGAGVCLDIDDADTVTAVPTFNSVFMSCTTGFRADGNAETETATLFNAGANNTSAGTSTLTAVNGSLVNFVNGANENAVTVTPMTTNATATSTNFSGQFFMSTPTNIGAVYPGNDTWINGWTCSPLIGRPAC